MKKSICFFPLILLFLYDLSFANGEIIPLKSHKILPVEGPENKQPSGLTIWNDTLFTVSDRHNDTIFRLELNDSTAVMIPYLTFEAPDSSGRFWFDFEGITYDGQHFYLASETHFRILKVSMDGREVAWITPVLKSYGKQEGLFQVMNANFEGIALLDPNHFILAAERHDRGVMEVDLNQSPMEVKVYNLESSKFSFPEDVSHDFSALYYYNHTLYILQRNAHLISELLPSRKGYREGAGWSYKQLVTADEWQYQDMRYGLAEGLSMDEDYIYIVLDNNGDYRVADPKDNRPLLLIMYYPQAE